MPADPSLRHTLSALKPMLAGGQTVLQIAHQMSTVRLCQRRILLRDGALAAEGSYGDLAALLPEFQSLVE